MFSGQEILEEFAESARLGYGRNNVSYTLESALIRALAYRRARCLRSQHMWISKPQNRLKKKLYMKARYQRLKKAKHAAERRI